MRSVTARVTDIALSGSAPRLWWALFLFGCLLLGGFLVGVTYLLKMGPGIWGINIPVAWGFAITNFVWWIGIGHAGTFISAILLLLNQKWRMSVSRLSEAMTIFAILCAALFPCIHLGRPWLVYWVLPYPNSMNIYSQFRSAFVWDAFAISTYGVVSFLFWYIGMIPDLAMIRDRAQEGRKKFMYGVLAMGWKGRGRDWRLFRALSLLLAGLATPLVISVHSVVALDFASSSVPGWTLTVFPPYFVAGAVFSGFAMVLVLGIFVRHTFQLKDVIRIDELEKVALLMLTTCFMVAYGYFSELWVAWFSGDVNERHALLNKMFGQYAFFYWLMLFCNVFAPQIMWSPRMRKSVPVLFITGSIVVFGMWLERFMIIITSLERGYMRSQWGGYLPTFWDWLILFGSIGLFIFCFMLFVKFFPPVPLHEIRAEGAKEG